MEKRFIYFGVAIYSWSLPVWPARMLGLGKSQIVRAFQRPNTGFVDVYYDLTDDGGASHNVSLQVRSDRSTPPLDTMAGDVGIGVRPGKNNHIVWDAGLDWPGSLDSNMVAVVAVEQTKRGEGMVWIPAGINEGVDPDFGPYALTNATGFWMDRTEVTFDKYKEGTWVSVL